MNTRGAWMCHRCAASGSWYDLKRRAGSGGARLVSQSVLHPSASSIRNSRTPRRAGSDEIRVAQQQRDAGLRPVPDQRRVASYPVNLFHNPRFLKVKEYLTGSEPGQRGIEERVLMKYGVGCAAYRRESLDFHFLFLSHQSS